MLFHLLIRVCDKHFQDAKTEKQQIMDIKEGDLPYRIMTGNCDRYDYKKGFCHHKPTKAFYIIAKEDDQTTGN